MRRLLLASLFPILLSGCVRRPIHQAALDQLHDLQLEQQARDEVVLQAQDRERRALATARDAQQSQLGLQTELDSAILENQELRELLSSTGDQAEALAELARRLEAQRGALTDERDRLSETAQDLQSRLLEAHRALAELRLRQQEAQERDRIFEEVRERLASMIDAGQLEVAIERGRLVIKLGQDVLFPSGSARVQETGRVALEPLGAALASFPERAFQVEGHTDDRPISTSSFASNWELSGARALAVLRLLVEAGVDPQNLSAAGYGEFQPRSTNETTEGRQLNRRIEIVMLPNLDWLAAELDSQGGPDSR